MIVRITPAELKTLVRRSLNIETADLTVEIVGTQDCPVAAALRSAIDKFPGFRTFEKIVAIKHFRDTAPRDSFGDKIGLADAKWAIENDQAAFRNLATYGRLHNA